MTAYHLDAPSPKGTVKLSKNISIPINGSTIPPTGSTELSPRPTIGQQWPRPVN